MKKLYFILILPLLFLFVSCSKGQKIEETKVNVYQLSDKILIENKTNKIYKIEITCEGDLMYSGTLIQNGGIQYKVEQDGNYMISGTAKKRSKEYYFQKQINY